MVKVHSAVPTAPLHAVPSNSLHACNKFMFENGLASDVKFICQTPGGSEEWISAHKYVLISRSTVFRAMLIGDLASCDNDVIKVTDVTPRSFKEVLRFLYYDEATLDEENILEILYCAKKYLLDALTTRCLSYLMDNMDEDNVCTILQVSWLYEERVLQSVCVEYIERHARAVLASRDFLDLPHHLVHLVASMEILNAPEVTLLEACLAWAEEECKRKGLKVTGRNQRNVLGCILYYIRMSQIPQDVIHQRALSTDLLTPSEKIILGNALNDINGVQHTNAGRDWMNSNIIYLDEDERSGNVKVETSSHVCEFCSPESLDLDSDESDISSICQAMPFMLSNRRRSKLDYSVCYLVQKRYTSTVIGGKWQPLKIETDRHVELIGLELLDKVKSCTTKVDVTVTQDGVDLGRGYASLTTPRQTVDGATLLNITFQHPVKVKPGAFEINVCYKFAFGMYGVIPSGQPTSDEIVCDDVTFKLDETSCSRIHSFNFRESTHV